MRYIWQHIQTILQNYTGGIPLSHFLKHYFRLHPKLGSRDRKILSDMAYSWYRASKAVPDSVPFEQRMRACLFLSEANTPQSRQFLPAEWSAATSADVAERIALVKESGLLSDISALASFRFTTSAGIEAEQWLGSMLQQPRLFIRIRKRREEISRLLQQNNLPFEELEPDCLSLMNGAPVDKLLPPDAYVVQDHSSQQTGTYFSPKAGEWWWDCCSGAGGKSLLLKDMEPAVQLTVSDKRASILHNLRERFKQYKHVLPVSVVADVAEPGEIEKHLAGKLFDNIICDVPCTGSGTWARTPEQLYFFNEEYVREFSERQRQIARNVSTYLKPGGRLIYITCSIFRQENEEVIDHLLSGSVLTLETKQLINGIEKKADSMFVAVLRKQ